MPTDYVRADSITEAIRYLTDAGDGARVIAGGQSLVPMMNLNLANPSVVVDISGIDDLKNISVRDGNLVVGAGVTHTDLISSSTVQEAVPLLAEAAKQIGSQRIRNFGTIGGSLAHADPAAELPLACHVLDASVDIVGPDGPRSIPVSDFTLGYYTTALQPGEMVQAVSIPSTGEKGWGFHEYARRAGDFAIVAVAALIEAQAGRITSAAIGVANVSDRPVRLTELEEEMLGAGPEEAIDLTNRVSDIVDPAEDDYVSADYRKRLAAALAKRAVTDALGGNEERR